MWIFSGKHTARVEAAIAAIASGYATLRVFHWWPVQAVGYD